MRLNLTVCAAFSPELPPITWRFYNKEGAPAFIHHARLELWVEIFDWRCRCDHRRQAGYIAVIQQLVKLLPGPGCCALSAQIVEH